MKKIDAPQTAIVLCDFIKKTVGAAHFSKVIVAVSGGVDSATSLSLAVKALGKENVYSLRLPYKQMHDEANKHAQLVIDSLDLPQSNQFTHNIASAVDALTKDLAVKDQTRVGNIMARMRMIALFDHAKKLNALVVGTENKSEHYLGYFTRFGDEASDIEPLRQLYKTQVYELALHFKVPQVILEKAPTAGLWQGQTDEGEFGFSYKEADQVLFGLFDEHLSTSELIGRGVKRETVEKVIAWTKKVDFKHQLPHIGPNPVY